VSWDFTTWLNIVFLLLAAALIARFVHRRHDAEDDGRRPDQPGAENGHAHHDMHGMTASDDRDGAHRAPAAPHQTGSRRPAGQVTKATLAGVIMSTRTL
jgi:hypothetical protein